MSAVKKDKNKILPRIKPEYASAKKETNNLPNEKEDTPDKQNNVISDKPDITEKSITDEIKSLYNLPCEKFSMESYIKLSTRGVIENTIQQHKVMMALLEKNEKANVGVCSLIECPIKKEFIATLYNTIQTIEETKNSFKSKQLGSLREDLEKILLKILGEKI